MDINKNLIDRILNDAFQNGSSDIILKGGKVIEKKQGIMSFLPDCFTDDQVRDVINEILGARAPLFQQRTDFDLSYQVDSGRLRVNIGLSQGKYFIYFRLIPSVIPDFATLQLPSELLTYVKMKRGIFLVTGPVGTGKSTTLAAMINHLINHEQRMVITLEDPIEFVYQGNSNNSLVVQREIGSDVPDFATGLRQALRQNPDIILVGEMRDRETVETAFNAALSGHLVLGTLHTISAIQTVERLVSLFPEDKQPDARMQLSLALKGIVSQALLPLANGRGRVPCIEILPINSNDIQKFVREGTPQKIRQVVETKIKNGAYPFDNYLLKLISEGKVDQKVALEYAQEPDALAGKVLNGLPFN